MDPVSEAPAQEVRAEGFGRIAFELRLPERPKFNDCHGPQPVKISFNRGVQIRWHRRALHMRFRMPHTLRPGLKSSEKTSNLVAHLQPIGLFPDLGLKPGSISVVIFKSFAEWISYFNNDGNNRRAQATPHLR